jgi:hypothetical protein
MSGTFTWYGGLKYFVHRSKGWVWRRNVRDRSQVSDERVESEVAGGVWGVRSAEGKQDVKVDRNVLRILA